MVSSYLVHNGYSRTAEAFSRTTGQTIREDMTSIRNRQSMSSISSLTSLDLCVKILYHRNFKVDYVWQNGTSN